ncbi:MAG TPA: hypothetical protein VJC03_01230, partial [bacterium]|nr:hypothetical protein [bacterium]
TALGGDKRGYAFYVKENMFVTNFGRYAAGGGLTGLRLWRKDAGGTPENAPYFSGEMEDAAGWGYLVDDGDERNFFLNTLYPLSAGTTYWIASVGNGLSDGVISKFGKVEPNQLGTNKIDLTVFDSGASFPYFYDPTDAPDSLSISQAADRPELEGAPDLKISQFDFAGVCATLGFDTGGSWVDYESFSVTFDSQIYKVPLVGLSLSDAIYTMKFINEETGPQADVQFEFADSTASVVSFPLAHTADLSSLSRRFVRWRMNVTTNHQGISPVVRSVSVVYNAHPEVSVPGYGISPSSSMAKPLTQPQPEFSWNNFSDAEGEALIYKFELSPDPVFSSVSILQSSTMTATAYTSPVSLEDKTTYYWRISAYDVKGASSVPSPAFPFYTSLQKFALSYSDVQVQGRYLLDEINPVKITFSKNVNPDTLDAGISLIDELGNSSGLIFSTTLSTSALLVPSTVYYVTLPELSSSRSYTLTLSDSIRDFEDISLDETQVIPFVILQSRQEAFSVQAGEALLTLPAQSVSGNFYLKEKVLDTATDPSLAQSLGIIESSAFLVSVTTYAWQFIATDAQGEDIVSISEGATLRIPFQDADGDGNVDSTDPELPAEMVRIFYQNPATGNWVLVGPVENQTVDIQAKEVSAPVTAFGNFSLFIFPAQPESQIQLRNVPNPFRAGSDDTAITYYMSEEAPVRATVYTLFGETVWGKKYPAGDSDGGHAGMNSWSWDGRNDQGMVLATGMYILELDIAGQKLYRKIGIYR